MGNPDLNLLALHWAADYFLGNNIFWILLSLFVTRCLKRNSENLKNPLKKLGYRKWGRENWVEKIVSTLGLGLSLDSLLPSDSHLNY
jgi:hypothetical protein